MKKFRDALGELLLKYKQAPLEDLIDELENRLEALKDDKRREMQSIDPKED